MLVHYFVQFCMMKGRANTARYIFYAPTLGEDRAGTESSCTVAGKEEQS